MQISFFILSIFGIVVSRCLRHKSYGCSKKNDQLYIKKFAFHPVRLVAQGRCFQIPRGRLHTHTNIRTKILLYETLPFFNEFAIFFSLLTCGWSLNNRFIWIFSIKKIVCVAHFSILCALGFIWILLEYFYRIGCSIKLEDPIRKRWYHK